jgi:predicted ATPase
MEAEVKRIEGELLFGLGESDERVDGRFLEAIEVAQRQSARSFELRASSSLYRFMRTRKSSDNAYLDLAQVYAWFSEGFDTPDLQVAKSLLDEGPWKP